MSELPISETPQAPGVGSGEAEEVDALPVLAGETGMAHPFPRALEPERRVAVIPAVQAAAVAAGGFVAGAAVVGLVRHRHRQASLAKGRRFGRDVGRGGRRQSRAGELVQIVGSRSLLLDVHLLGGPGAEH